MRQALGRRDLKPAATGVYPRNTTAVKSALLDLRAGDPGAVILVGAYQPVTTLISWARHIGFEPVFFTISFVGSNALARALGSAGAGVFVTQVVPFPTADRPPAAAAYRRALAAHAPCASPGFVSFEGYLAGRLAIFALDLEGKVEIGGRDEVAEMAAALEVFRRHALEVQRLNLVEKLAEELRGKNDQLEEALAELERAQDQIVMGEKLAALGELTAGVAHEIKNPLNFVRNFSEVSEELLQKLMAEIPRATGEADAEPDEESRDLIDEIGGDLTGNLRRIREHGERANQIVQSMLMMGRGSGDWQPTDINALLSEHARLAYHNARVNDPAFRVDVEEDFDPELGESEVIPQDLGRVFLNMVSNACYATDEKRRAASGTPAGEAAAAYQPRLRLATRRLADGIEIRIRDNGSGIPPDIVDKIFDPFFTTKPTDQGTGLGLSLSNDIVRQHVGSTRVDSEPDTFTEMIIKLPANANPPPSGAT